MAYSLLLAAVRSRSHNRAPFLLLELSSWRGTIFLFLEHIALSCATHAITCCEDFSGVTPWNGVQNSQNVWCFWPTTQYVYVYWNSALAFSWHVAPVLEKQDSVEFSYVPLSVTGQVKYRCLFYMAPHLRSKFHICWRLAAFHE